MSRPIAYNASGPAQSFTAAEALTEYTFVTLGASGVSVADAATAPIYAVQATYASGDTGVKLYNVGTGRITCDGSGTAIAAGDRLTATTNGIGIKATTDGQWVGAIALEACTASGDDVLVLFIGPAQLAS